VQGDEPELEASCIDRLVQRLLQDTDCPMATCACPFSAVPGGDPSDPHAVKVVIDRRGRALYFSRSAIPHLADPDAADASAAPYLHLGIYAYRRDFLQTLARLEATPMERMERLEQLRVLEHGYSIAVEVVARAAVGIDTPEDYAAFVRRYETQST
jgi:3-deoxy-manno-octulosonate cytidylyltransferase (CMP-KDO synthetase)